MAISYKYGIDFGTTNSSISIVKKDASGKKQPIVYDVDDFQPHQVIKSIVGFRDSEEIVGDNGMYSLEGAEDNPIREVKMRLFSQGKDAEIAAVPGKTYTDAMAAILRVLKLKADNELRGTDTQPDGVVIGHPCDATESIKNAYRLALTKAGFYKNFEEAKDKTEFLDEPCAVALFYGNKKMLQNQRVLIFDFGGGTLDLAVVDLQEQSIEAGNKATKKHKVIAKDSKYEAGEHFTRILFSKVFCPAYIEQHCGGNAFNMAKKFRRIGCTANRPDDIYSQLKEKAGACWKFIHEIDSVKAQLSFNNTADFYCECDSIDGSERVVFETTTLKQSDYEAALILEIRKNEEFINTFLHTKGIKKDTIDQVILAGGSSSIPAVHRSLEKLFPGKIKYDEKKEGTYYVNMMTCIAQGLAIQGYYDNPAMDNVTAHDYGFWNAYEKSVEVVIPKGTNFSKADVDISEMTPKTEFYRVAEQDDVSAKAFKMHIYEDSEEIMELHFNKTIHGGKYKIYFAINEASGTLKIAVWDMKYDKWVDDLSEEDMTYNIQVKKS